MRLRSLSGMCLVSLLVGGVVSTACGSSNDKRKTPGEHLTPSGGEGGEPSTAGTAGTAGTVGTAGTAGAANGGESAVSLGGAAGNPSVEPTAGSPTGVAGAAGSDTGAPFHGLYVGGNGDDLADGTVDAPFKTLAHAVSVATAGDTIVFLDGTYAVAASTVIPNGVDLMAQNSGAVTLTGGNAAPLTLAGTSRLEGLKFQTFSTVVQFQGDTTATGSVTIVDSSFVQCQTTCLKLTGDTSAVVSSAPSAVLGNAGVAFATHSEQATLSVSGGVLKGYTAGNVFGASATASVALNGVSVLDGTAKVLDLNNDATATLDHVTLMTSGQGLIQQKGQSEVTITNSDLSMNVPAANAFYCLRLDMDGVGSVDITDSKLHDCNTGFSGTIPGALTLTRVEVSSMAYGGIELGYSFQGVGGNVRITDSKFHDFGYIAMRMGSGTNLNDYKLRGTEFANNATAMWDTVWLEGGAASTFDFGTVGDPGGNAFTNANAAQTSFRTQSAAIYISAVGNTWLPNQEGADAQGHYSAPAGSGNKLEIQGPVAAGRNYIMPSASSKLLLAENP